MDRTALRTELKDLGHNYGTPGWDARLDRFLNQAAKDVIGDENWPQRRATATVAAGAVVPRLGQIKQVLRTSTQFALAPRTLDDLRDDYPGPILAGEPLYYYVTANAAVSTWPAATVGTIDVDHFDRGCWLAADGVTRKIESTADTDTLLGADVFEEAVLLAARLRVLEDSDENELRESLQLRLRGRDGTEGVMLQLRDRQLQINADEPTYIKQTREWV